MPNFVKSREFWKAASLVIAAVVAYFWPESALTVAKVEALVFAVLSLFGVNTELRSRGIL